ncbi:MAG: CRTAC1 family protein [Pseudomonadota bacterium]|nr:CRTAC1 family protein [Pseudomonadota bacterium]
MVLLLLAAAVGCAEPPLSDSGIVIPGLVLGRETVCAAPASGFGPFAEESVARGVDAAIGDYEHHPGGSASATLTVEDLDADGDIDLAFPDLHGSPLLFENDGTGHFTEVPTALSVYGGGNHGVADIDADGLPDLVMVGIGHVFVAQNLGGMAFARPEEVFVLDDPAPTFATFTAGDIDLDGDIDLVVPGLSLITDPCQLDGSCAASGEGSPVYVLVNEGGTFRVGAMLSPQGVSGYSLVATLTDRDRDGDLDLFVPSDHSGMPPEGVLPPNAFYRNDGVGADGDVVWVNEAAALELEFVMSGMGIATGDYNGDDQLDYCVSDFGPVRCFLSDRESYYDAGVAMGLSSGGAELTAWAGWSVELVDLDNNGELDAFVTGGRASMNEQGGSEHQPDLLFEGGAGGTLQEVGDAQGFGSDADDYGAAAADLDGDGVLEVVITPSIGAPQLYHAPCNAHGWLAVDLAGPAGNPLGLGTRVDVEAGGRRWTQEIQALRGPGQSPSLAWFGLGGADAVDRLVVTWPGGAVQEFEAVPARRTVTVMHPERG